MTRSSALVHPLVLALDTATDVTSVALLELAPGEPLVLGGLRGGGRRAGSRRILALVDELLRAQGAEPGDLAALLVGVGPGTFTGVRIGVATARALGLALGVPVVGVSTLAALAAAALRSAAPEVVVPWVDARRGEVFAAVYRAVHAGARPDTAGSPRWERLGEPFAASPAALTEAVVARSGRDGLRVGGPGVVRAEFLVLGQERLLEPGDAPAGHRLLPWLRARVEGRLLPGGRSPDPGAWGSPESVTPVYVRPPDADVHITKMRDPWAR